MPDTHVVSFESFRSVFLKQPYNEHYWKNRIAIEVKGHLYCYELLGFLDKRYAQVFYLNGQKRMPISFEFDVKLVAGADDIVFLRPLDIDDVTPIQYSSLELRAASPRQIMNRLPKKISVMGVVYDLDTSDQTLADLSFAANTFRKIRRMIGAGHVQAENEFFAQLANTFKDQTQIGVEEVYDVFVGYSQIRARDFFVKKKFKNVPDPSKFPLHSDEDHVEVPSSFPMHGWILSEKARRGHSVGTSIQINYFTHEFAEFDWSSDD